MREVRSDRDSEGAVVVYEEDLTAEVERLDRELERVGGGLHLTKGQTETLRRARDADRVA